MSMSALLSAGTAPSWMLPALLVWPVVAAGIVWAVGRDSQTLDTLDFRDARLWTVGALAIEALLALAMCVGTDSQGAGWLIRYDRPWLPDMGASISLGVDGLSLPMVVVTAVVLPVSLLSAWRNVRVRTPAFGALVLLLTAGLMGVLITLDLLLFYVAWELLLIPTYFLVGIWGTGRAAGASIRYVLFMLVGSLLMLVALLALWLAGGARSFHLEQLLLVALPLRTQLLMFGAFFLAFAAKSAFIPVHAWLPDAQESAPTFAAITLGLKVGIYAMLRFAIPLFPAAAALPAVRTTIMGIAVGAIVYGAVLAMTQHTMKRWISYAAISHMGFLMLGTFALTPLAIQGAIVIMINHAITTTLLFLIAGGMVDDGGEVTLSTGLALASHAPRRGILLMLAVLSTIGLPGTNGFVGEFLVLLGTFTEAPVLTAFATAGVVLAAVYGMRLLQQALFASPEPVHRGAIADLSLRHTCTLAGFGVAIVWLGIAPGGLLRAVEGPARHVVEAVHFGANAGHAAVAPGTGR